MANLTAEDPDQLKCFRFAFTPTSGLVCEFPITICNDHARVGSDVGLLCAPPPSIINGTNPPAPIIYSSNAQTCTVDCGDGTSETHNVAPGTFVATTQGDADLAARIFACQLADMLCDGPLPPTFTNTKQTCVATCTNGETVSYSTPAGFFTALSQAEADMDAFLFACEIAALLCNDLPPTGTLPGAGTPRPPVEPLYASAAATCVATCSNGSVYSFTVDAGAFLAESRDAANAMASSYACRQAQLRRVCLSNLQSSLCVNEFESAFVDSTGLAEPVSYTVSAGSLPAGMTLEQSGFFSGTPTTVGSSSFAITATGSDGQSTSRAYTISVAGIDQVVLTEAELDEPYSEQLTQTGMSGAVTWAITDGFLPDGITLNSTGLLDGAPTEDGDFPVTIAIANGTDTCSRDFVLTVAASQVQVYWPLEGPSNGNTDAVSGQALFVNNFGSVLTSPPAKVGNGFRITGGFCNLSQTTQALLYTGNGFTVAVWINWVPTGAIEGFQYSFCSAPIQNLTWTVNNTGNGTFDFVYNGAANITGPTVEPSSGVWHLVVLKYDPANGNLSMSVDGAAFVVLGNVPVVPVNPEPSPYMLVGNENITWDEVGVFAFPFTAADLAYIWNSGNGRTWPLSFPP